MDPQPADQGSLPGLLLFRFNNESQENPFQVQLLDSLQMQNESDVPIDTTNLLESVAPRFTPSDESFSLSPHTHPTLLLYLYYTYTLPHTHRPWAHWTLAGRREAQAPPPPPRRGVPNPELRGGSLHLLSSSRRTQPASKGQEI